MPVWWLTSLINVVLLDCIYCTILYRTLGKTKFLLKKVPLDSVSASSSFEFLLMHESLRELLLNAS